MKRFVRESLLYRRMTEAWNSYRSLRRTEHRAALKMKRAAVKARVMHEMRMIELESASLRMKAMRQAARVRGAMEVGKVVDERSRRMNEIVEKWGAEEMKRDMIQNVEKHMGDGVAGKVGRGVLQDMFDGVEGQSRMGLIVGVAEKLGVERKELEQMVEIVEEDKGKREELMNEIRREMEKRKKGAEEREEGRGQVGDARA